MKRKDLVEKIVKKLVHEEILDSSNYVSVADQAHDVFNIICQELEDYVLIKGEVIQ